ncbi:MAG: hypothetical protein M3O67_02235 [Bacteroidota bacterium]|nr:hypothetical protein [Bacteroidota bacterium]
MRQNDLILYDTVTGICDWIKLCEISLKIFEIGVARYSYSIELRCDAPFRFQIVDEP